MQSTPWETGLEETQTGIKIARRNINNLRYADDTTLMAEREEELKSLLMKLPGKGLITVELVLEVLFLGRQGSWRKHLSSFTLLEVPTAQNNKVTSLGWHVLNPCGPVLAWCILLPFNSNGCIIGCLLISKTYRWGNSVNSVRLYFGGLQNHCRLWLQPWN